MFKPGNYYVGDPVFILPNNELRSFFSEYLHLGQVKSGYRDFSLSPKDLLWVTSLPHLRGTLYSQLGNSIGFDWGVFGCVPEHMVAIDSDFPNERIEFTKPFECSHTNDRITIGHLYFTLTPQNETI